MEDEPNARSEISMKNPKESREINASYLNELIATGLNEGVPLQNGLVEVVEEGVGTAHDIIDFVWILSECHSNITHITQTADSLRHRRSLHSILYKALFQ